MQCNVIWTHIHTDAQTACWPVYTKSSASWADNVSMSSCRRFIDASQQAPTDPTVTANLHATPSLSLSNEDLWMPQASVLYILPTVANCKLCPAGRYTAGSDYRRNQGGVADKHPSETKPKEILLCDLFLSGQLSAILYDYVLFPHSCILSIEHRIICMLSVTLLFIIVFYIVQSGHFAARVLINDVLTYLLIIWYGQRRRRMDI